MFKCLQLKLPTCPFMFSWKILIPSCQMSITCFLEDIVPMLPDFHVRFFYRYCSLFEIFQNANFMFFWKILIPCSRFSRTYQTDLQDFEGPVFSHLFAKYWSSKILTFPSIIFAWIFSRIILNTLVSPKSRIIGFGAHGHVR